MVAAIPLVRRMCLLAVSEKCFFYLAINFLGLFVLPVSSDHCCYERFLSFVR